MVDRDVKPNRDKYLTKQQRKLFKERLKPIKGLLWAIILSVIIWVLMLICFFE